MDDRAGYRNIILANGASDEIVLGWCGDGDWNIDVLIADFEVGDGGGGLEEGVALGDSEVDGDRGACGEAVADRSVDVEGDDSFSVGGAWEGGEGNFGGFLYAEDG